MPVAIVVALVLWGVMTPISIESGVGLGVMLLTLFVLRQFSNLHQLIRVRSWTVSSVFILLVGFYAVIHKWDIVAACGTLLYLIHIMGLLTSYQSERPQNGTLIAMIALSALTMLQPAMLYVLLLSLVAMASALRTITLKSLVAVLFGVLMPYEIWVAWHLYCGDLQQAFVEWSTALYTFSVPQIVTEGSWMDILSANLLDKQRMLVILIGIYGLISIFHFIRTCYNDKISTRMHYYTLIVEWPALILAVVFCPDNAPLNVCVLLLSCSPLLAHYFVFSKGWLAFIMFLLFLLSCLFLQLPIL